MRYKIIGHITHEFTVDIEAENEIKARQMAISCAKTGIGSGAVKDGPVQNVTLSLIITEGSITETGIKYGDSPWKNQADGAVN